MQVGPLKRVAALFVTFVFLLGFVPAYATQGNEADGQVVVESKSAAAGEEVTVSVSLNGVPDIAGFEFLLQYDSAVLTLVASTAKSPAGVQVGRKLDANPYKVSWMSATQQNTDANGVICELTFQVNQNATGSSTVSVSYNQSLVFATTSDEKMADVNPKPVNGVIAISPPAGIAITSVRRDNKTITADIINPDSSATAFCGIYSNSGQFVAIRSCKITDALTYDFQFNEYQFDYAKVFLLSESLMPLCAGRKSQ